MNTVDFCQKFKQIDLPCLNFFSHSVHGNLYSSLCVSICALCVLIWANDLPQVTHWYGRSFVCILFWVKITKKKHFDYYLVQIHVIMYWLNKPHMRLISARMIEFFRTKCTSEWMLPCMLSQMEFIGFCIKKCLFASDIVLIDKITFVWTFLRMIFPI